MPASVAAAAAAMMDRKESQKSDLIPAGGEYLSSTVARIEFWTDEQLPVEPHARGVETLVAGIGVAMRARGSQTATEETSANVLQGVVRMGILVLVGDGSVTICSHVKAPVRISPHEPLSQGLTLGRKLKPRFPHNHPSQGLAHALQTNGWSLHASLNINPF